MITRSYLYQDKICRCIIYSCVVVIPIWYLFIIVADYIVRYIKGWYSPTLDISFDGENKWVTE